MLLLEVKYRTGLKNNTSKQNGSRFLESVGEKDCEVVINSS